MYTTPTLGIYDIPVLPTGVHSLMGLKLELLRVLLCSATDCLPPGWRFLFSFVFAPGSRSTASDRDKPEHRFSGASVADRNVPRHPSL